MVSNLHIDTIEGLESVVNGTANPSTVVIFVHGIPGHKDIGQLREASCELVTEKLATTIRYSLKRDQEKEREIEHSWRKDFPLLKSLALVATYRGTYLDAQVDLHRVIDNISDKFQPQQIYLSGHSYGAGLVALAAASDPAKIKGILLSNPLISLGWWRKSLLWDHETFGKECFFDFPKEQQFLESIASYHGKIWIVHSENDSIVSPQNTAKMYAAAKPENRTLITLPGKDHDFIGESRKKYVQAHLDFVRD